MLLLMLGSMLVLLFLGFPLMVPTIVGPLVVLDQYFPSIPMSMVLQQMISGVRLMTLIAIPMFIFAAKIMTKGTSADRLIEWVTAFVGHVPGGLAIATSGSCTAFGAISGSAQATAVAIGQPMLPKLVKHGYSPSYGIALIITASGIALLIPPSIGMILYGVITNNSIGDLFIAGIGPGLLVFFLFALYSHWHARRHNIPLTPKATWKERLRYTKRALPAFGFPVLIVGGIYSGLFNPNEAAGVSVAYAIILEVFVYRAVKLRELQEIALDTGLITSVVFILLAMGAAFSWVVTFARIPNQILPYVFGPDSGIYYTMAVVTVAYFIACMFVDNIVVIMILTPILYPIAMKTGVDPIVLGVIITLQAAIGACTPPFGANIFTAIAVFRRPYWDCVKSTPVFIAIMMLTSVILMFFPQISLFLTGRS